jgi:hypothetical protein
VRRNLEEVATEAIGFYTGVLPMTVGVMSEQQLLLEQRRYFRQHEHGPLRAIEGVAEYVRREQRLGRISHGVSPEHVARLVLGAAFQHAFMVLFLGPDSDALGPDERFVKDTIRTLMEGLKPKEVAG